MKRIWSALSAAAVLAFATAPGNVQAASAPPPPPVVQPGGAAQGPGLGPGSGPAANPRLRPAVPANQATEPPGPDKAKTADRKGEVKEQQGVVKDVLDEIDQAVPGAQAVAEAGKKFSMRKGEADNQSWLADFESPLAILAGLAIVLAAMGLALWALQTRELRAVQTALKSNPPILPNPTGRESELQALFTRLLVGMQDMQKRIGELQAEIDALKSAERANSAAAERAGQDGDFYAQNKGRSQGAHRREEDEWPPARVQSPSPPPPPPPQPLTFSDDDAAVASLSQDPQVQQILQDYNRAAQSGAKALIGAFMDGHHPTEVAILGEGALVDGDDDLLWFVAAPNSDYGLVLPGASPIRGWHLTYRTMMGQQARERFGVLYEVVDGPEMLVLKPAWVKASGGRYQIVKTGRLSGALKGA